MTLTTRSSYAGGECDRGAVTFPLPDGIIVERDVRVVMRDGVKLAATIYLPDRQGRFPVVMCVTAYGKDLGPAAYTTLPNVMNMGLAVGTFCISDVTTWEGPDPAFWVPHGYVVIIANARGFYESEGDPGIYSAQDVDDYADLIDWAGGQAWSSGAVGLNGVSYLAITQWMVASQAKPAHLKAIVPWEGLADNLRDAVQHGGIPETRFVNGWLRGSLARGAGDGIITAGPAMIDDWSHRPFPLENIDVPALVCASWSNHGLHSRGSIEGFMRIGSRQKWLYTHGGLEWETYYSAEALEWQKAFFDQFLKGENNGFDRRSPIRLEVRHDQETFEVKEERTWPPEGTRYVPHYLDIDRGALLHAAPAAKQSASYDASTTETLEFDLSFDRDVEVSGSMALKLWVAAESADDLDLYVVVRKIGRDGREVHFYGKDGVRDGVVSQGWLRVSQRRLDPERSSPWRPFLSHDRIEKVQPGEVVPVDVEILPSSTLFAAGETLRLVIGGREILEQKRFGHDSSVNLGLHTIHAGGPRPSHLLVPTRTR